MATHISPVVLRREVGRRIRLARQHAGLTVVEAAARLEITRSALSRFENGTGGVNVHLLRSMMDVYDERMDDVLDTLVPGLLRTAEYARALFTSGTRARSDEWIANQLAIRLNRQERLTDEEHRSRWKPSCTSSPCVTRWDRRRSCAPS